MFVVRCPKCKQTMRYAPVKEGVISEKKKTCVYCGKTFKIHPSYVLSRIVKEEKKHTTTPLFKSADEQKMFEEKLGKK